MNNPAKQLKTIEDLEKIIGDERAELIDGEIVMMAAQVSPHSNAQSAIDSPLRAASKKIKRDPLGPDEGGIRILTEAWTFYDQHNSFSHDIAGFWRKELAELPQKGPIRVRPFWVCEVLSPSNWIKDTQMKRRVLERAGVPYYWIVDPLRQGIEVLELKPGSEHYQVLVSVAREEGIVKLPPFLEVEIDLEDVFG